MRTLAPLVLFMSFVLFGCNSSPKNAGVNAEDKNFFPVTGYIESQLHGIDSLQLPVTRYYSGEGYGDTTLLSIAECRALAAPFLETDISDPKWKDKYIENSFADQSIPSISFTYETRDNKLPVKRVDIVLKPDPVTADKVKTVYIEKLFQHGDTLINEKLFWKADHYYQVISSKQVGNNQPMLTQLKVVWDPTE
ncbi:hypothetical protein [Flavihumibacter fluvii]|uniref:hypothetical protein n=1 Tax=Flavihumibacter fluvii TaxID=2838157 RepID=UPI001BDE2E0A|nr:hypothetical protein [Flavihumibacter fluvii]ULQ52463.1 hypothetical protein KJS93_20455 [Flavihumibacter fluvii]